MPESAPVKTYLDTDLIRVLNHYLIASPGGQQGLVNPAFVFVMTGEQIVGADAFLRETFSQQNPASRQGDLIEEAMTAATASLATLETIKAEIAINRSIRKTELMAEVERAINNQISRVLETQRDGFQCSDARAANVYGAVATLLREHGVDVV